VLFLWGEIVLIEELLDLKRTITEMLQNVSRDRQFDELLSSLLFDIDSMSDSRLDYKEILSRMFDRLNENLANPFDDRQSSTIFNVMAPIAISLTEIGILIRIFKSQVFVLTASGSSLDSFGADYDLPRFEATQAIRIGYTLDTNMNKADFPLGRVFRTREALNDMRFEIYKTNNGDVLWRCLDYGVIGNAYYGDLSPAQPVNGLGRAVITGTLIPAQDIETDEQYRKRLLRYLRRKAFGGNVPQYQEELQKIDGIGDSLIFPVWRGYGTSKAVILDSQNHPVSPEFVEYVNNIIDPIVRSGTGFGIAPIGHRVTCSTGEWLDVTINVTVAFIPNIEFGQGEQQLKEAIEKYFVEVRQNVVSEWERSYYANDGIFNNYVNIKSRFEALHDLYNDPEIMDLYLHFPAEHAIQTHNYFTRINRSIIAARLLETRLLADVDFENILIQGLPRNLDICQNQESILIPRLKEIFFEVVDFIEPHDPDAPCTCTCGVCINCLSKP